MVSRPVSYARDQKASGDAAAGSGPSLLLLQNAFACRSCSRKSPSRKRTEQDHGRHLLIPRRARSALGSADTAKNRDGFIHMADDDVGPAVVVEITDRDSAHIARRVGVSAKASREWARIVPLRSSETSASVSERHPGPTDDAPRGHAHEEVFPAVESASRNAVPQPTYFWPIAAMPAASSESRRRACPACNRCGTARAVRSRSWSPRATAARAVGSPRPRPCCRWACRDRRGHPLTRPTSAKSSFRRRVVQVEEVVDGVVGDVDVRLAVAVDDRPARTPSPLLAFAPAGGQPGRCADVDESRRSPLLR